MGHISLPVVHHDKALQNGVARLLRVWCKYSNDQNRQYEEYANAYECQEHQFLKILNDSSIDIFKHFDLTEQIKYMCWVIIWTDEKAQEWNNPIYDDAGAFKQQHVELAESDGDEVVSDVRLAEWKVHLQTMQSLFSFVLFSIFFLILYIFFHLLFFDFVGDVRKYVQGWRDCLRYLEQSHNVSHNVCMGLVSFVVYSDLCCED